MRELERDAYERGNMMFRDWEDKQNGTYVKTKNIQRSYQKCLKKHKIKVMKGNEKPVDSKPVSNDGRYQNNLYKSNGSVG